MKSFLYYLTLIVCAPFALIFFKMKVSYEGGKKFKIPKGAIIISPHKKVLDCFLLSYLFFFNRVHILAADWYKGFLKIFKPFMLMLGAVLVDVSGENYDFINKSQMVLGRGKNLLVFPEGDFKYNKYLFEFGEFKTGYLLIASKTGAPIVPIMFDFSYGLFKRVHIKVGKPLYVELSHNQQISNINDIIKTKCLDLFYQIKKERADKIKIKYEQRNIKKGDIIRVKENDSYSYGLYIDENHVINFNYVYNHLSEIKEIKTMSLSTFTNNKKPEIRIINRAKTRSIEEIEKYLKEIINQANYPLKNYSCLDFINCLTLKI